MIAPHVEQLVRDFAGRATVAKLNTDENPQATQQYRIMSISTLYIVKLGAVVDQSVGAHPFQVIRQRFMQHV